MNIQPHSNASDTPDPYEALGVTRTAGVDEIRRSYKQKVLETHPDKLPPTASEEEKNSAQELFRQVQEAFEILNDPAKRRAYDIHHRPLPQNVPIRANSRASTLSRTTTSVPTSALSRTTASVPTSTLSRTTAPVPTSTLSRTTAPVQASTLSRTATSASTSTLSGAATSVTTSILSRTTTSVSTSTTASRITPVSTSTLTPKPAQASTLPPVDEVISRPERPHSSTVMVRLEQLDKVQAHRAKERSEWARRTEERRLDKLKAYSVAEEIQSLGQRKADLVDKMIQDLFALTPEWEVRRMKVRAYKASGASARTH